MDLRVNFEDLENAGFDSGGEEILKYQGDYFTGIIESRIDGVLYGEEEYKNGYREGVHRHYYYPGGNIKSENTLKNDGLDGLFTRWNEDGTIQSQSKWLNGERV